MRERIMNDECLLDDNNHHHRTSADDTDSVTERITKIEVHAAKQSEVTFHNLSNDYFGIHCI